MYFNYECIKCKDVTEELVKSGERDDERHCDCGGERKRIPHQINVGKPAYQMQAVHSSGEHIKGHFGKEAKRDKRGRKK